LSSPPRLSPADVQQRLQEIFRDKHRSHLVAFYGSGDETDVDGPDGTRFHVQPVKSELELRTLVPDSLEGDPHTAFLVPFPGPLPLDVGCVFADDGRVFTLGRSLRLKRMFGASEIEPAARESALAHFLLDSPPLGMPKFGGRLTLESLWATWLSTWGLPEEGLSLESLMAWGCTSEAGRKFRTTVPEDVRRELLGYLVRRTAPSARLIWTAWESGVDRTKPFELGLLFDAMREQDSQELRSGELRMWRRVQVKALGVGADGESDSVARELADKAAVAFRIMHGRDAAFALKLLQAAEARVDDELVRSALAGSSLLPSAWGQRLDALGAAFSAAADRSEKVTFERVLRAWKALEVHQLFKDKENRLVLERADMAVRLVAWLVARTDQAPHPTASSYSEVEWLATWYANEGGFVDWARRRARGSDPRPFGRGVNAVVQAADAVRVELDRTFARTLPEWLKAGSPEGAIVSIEHAVEQFGARFLAERGDRKLLVLLMDGMAWAQAVEILGSLPSWGVLSWRAVNGKGSAFAPVIASLPTITDVSRAAFFSGKRMPPGRPEPTDKDVERWAGHSKLRSFVRQGEAPRLLLRAEGHTQSGAVSQEALTMVADSDQRVVAVVINAIDSSLKADTQQRMYWTVDHIQSLRELLEAAQAAGRAVLLAADHGHVAADHMTGVSASQAKARWRVWETDSDPVAEYEVGFEKSIAWAPPGAHGVVLLADDEHRYGGAPHTGEHGGATLAEVVAPALLVGADALAGSVGGRDEDQALRVSSFPVPPWWYPTLETAPPAAREAHTPAPKRRNTPKPTRLQLELPGGSPTPAPDVAAPKAHPLRLLLEASDTFVSLGLPGVRRTQMLTAVDFLAQRDGEQAPLAAFATAMGTVPPRARGLVEVLSERLNLDGFTLLSYDAASDLVKLDAAKLQLLYGKP